MDAEDGTVEPLAGPDIGTADIVAVLAGHRFLALISQIVNLSSGALSGGASLHRSRFTAVGNGSTRQISAKTRRLS